MAKSMLESSTQVNSLAERHLLFIEDVVGQARSVADTLGEQYPGCKTTVAYTVAQAEAYLNTEDDKPPFDIISIDLGLDGDREGYGDGLSLLYKFRAEYQTLPIVIHSMRSPKAAAVADILANRASFLLLLDENDMLNYAHFLPEILKGYLVFSPRAASHFSQVVATQMNPLPKREYWQTLEYIAHPDHLSYRQIGDRLGLAAKAIKARVRKIAEVLAEYEEMYDDDEQTENTDETQSDDDEQIKRYRPLLTRWYKENRYRYKYHQTLRW